MLSRFSHVRLFVTLWTVARQAPLSMGFSRHEYWSGLLCPPPKDLPNPETEPTSLTSPALATGKQVLYHWASWKALKINYTSVFFKKKSFISSARWILPDSLNHWTKARRSWNFTLLSSVFLQRAGLGHFSASFTLSLRQLKRRTTLQKRSPNDEQCNNWFSQLRASKTSGSS